MKLHKLFQLAYDVHTCRMIPWLVIILKEDMCTSGTIPTTIPDTTPVITPPTTQTDTRVIPTEKPIITPTIPPSPDYTPASLDYSHASDTESNPLEDPSSGHIPPSHHFYHRMMTSHTLAVRYFANHSSSDYFSLDDSARDSSSNSSSKASSDFHSDASFDSSSRHSLSSHSSPLPSTSVGPSRKRRRVVELERDNRRLRGTASVES
nr:hypothetical protein [Tanacetum cinerariifolium]